MEYRLRDTRWLSLVSGRANPMRETAGKIIKWFGTCTDIEEQKHNQQILEEQIRQRTEELADANTKLQEEMWEKDKARRQLDEQNENMLRRTDRALAARHHAGQDGRTAAKLRQPGRSIRRGLGFRAENLSPSRGALALLDAGRNVAEVAGSWNECALPVTVFEPSACWALRTGHPHLVVAGDQTARCAHAAGVKHTYLCIPILAQGEAFGILHFQATDEAPYWRTPNCRSRPHSPRRWDCRWPISVCAKRCAPSRSAIRSPVYTTAAIWEKCWNARPGARCAPNTAGSSHARPRSFQEIQ